MIGDVRFYYSSGSIPDEAILAATGGPFVHVDMDVGNGECVGALSQGIVRTAINPDTMVEVYHLSAGENIQHAVAWALAQVGHAYGWFDLANAGVADIFSRITHEPFLPYVGIKGAWDCSDFALRYLEVAGHFFMQPLVPAQTSPSDLARALGVIV